MFRPVLHLGVSSARDAVCSHYGVYYLKDQCLVRYCGCVYLGPVPIKLAIINYHVNEGDTFDMW